MKNPPGCAIIKTAKYDSTNRKEVCTVVTMIKILVKIIKISIAIFKLTGGPQRWVDEMEERYGIE